MFRRAALLVAAMGAVCLSCVAQVEYVPVQFRTVEGIRPFVPATLNGTPFLLMVHANASFYVQTTHANAAKAGIKSRAHDADFGIDKGGHVSSLGMTRATLGTLTVGKNVDHDVPLSIFEVPITGMDGMLGIGWLRGNGVIVDYDRQRLGFAATDEAAAREDARLVHDGFIAHAMKWDPKAERYSVAVEIDGKPARMVVSTVSSNIVDKAFAERGGIELGPVVYLDSGPTGAQVPDYLAKHALMITIDGQRTAWTQPIVQDTYGYSKAQRVNGAEMDGYLGCDFMLANEAVIDFRTGKLLLRPQRYEQMR